jgi:hypothetical protein
MNGVGYLGSRSKATAGVVSNRVSRRPMAGVVYSVPANKKRLPSVGVMRMSASSTAAQVSKIGAINATPSVVAGENAANRNAQILNNKKNKAV